MALALDAGQLEVAAATSVAAGILPVVLHDWLQQHRAIEVSLLEYPHRRGLDEAVRDGAGDIAVGSQPASWQGSVEHLGWEEFVVVLPDGDPLLDADSVSLTDLADRPWVHFTHAHGLAEVLDFCCGTAGFAPRVAVRTSQVTRGATVRRCRNRTDAGSEPHRAGGPERARAFGIAAPDAGGVRVHARRLDGPRRLVSRLVARLPVGPQATTRARVGLSSRAGHRPGIRA